jgi:adenine phosphoribosyltransferase
MPVKEKLSIAERIKNAIRDVPDFPKPGIIFKDITPILSKPVLCEEIEEEFLIAFDEMNIDAIAGIESRGFLFGMSLAKQLSVPFIPVRKKGKLPYKTIAYEYELEYGAAVIEMHTDAISKGMNVLIHDDLLQRAERLQQLLNWLRCKVQTLPALHLSWSSIS